MPIFFKWINLNVNIHNINMESSHLIQIKIEPTDHQYDEINLKVEPDEEVHSHSVKFTNYYEDIKQEPLDTVHIKTEPVDYDDTCEDDSSEHQEHILPDIPIEIDTSAFKKPEDGGTLLTSRLRPRIQNKKAQIKDAFDDDYKPAKTKKKIQQGKKKINPFNDMQNKKKKKSNVKPSIKGKPKTDDQKYSDEITKHIEIVTIDEAARLKEHNALFNSRKLMNYTCEPCALGFVVEKAYHMHMKIHSEENGGHLCDICQARMKTADVLYRHKLRHYRRYRCVICLLQLRDKDTVAAHVMREHLGAAFVCQHCGRDFKRPQYLKRHIEQMHTRPLHLECPVCRRVFYERGWYRCHVRTHNEEVRRNIERKAICSECGREFRNKAYLARHLQTHEDRRTASCKHCRRSFKNVEVLRVHVRQHHARQKLNKDGTVMPNLAGRSYAGSTRDKGRNGNTTCMQCGRVLTTRAMLIRHTQRMHTDHTKKFQCDYCKKFYFTKAEVRSHIEWTHLQRRVHACTCGRVFRTPARLRHHACSVHLRLQPPRDKRCAQCGKMFANRQVLNRHVKSHSGEMYPCTECGQKFKTQSYVKVHYKLKHLNMTRAEIKAQTKRKLIMVDNMDEVMNARVRKAVANMNIEDPLNISNVGLPELKKEPDLEVPSFETFLGIAREY